jgi:osmotically-inducible protein OsmY
VLLAGKAESLASHLRAIETAASVAGVRSVRSEIESPDARADTVIWRNVAATEKAASGEKSAAAGAKATMTDATPGLEINVDSDDGVVTLFGSVPTEASKATAEAEARKVSGVKQ